MENLFIHAMCACLKIKISSQMRIGMGDDGCCFYLHEFTCLVLRSNQNLTSFFFSLFFCSELKILGCGMVDSPWQCSPSPLSLQLHTALEICLPFQGGDDQSSSSQLFSLVTNKKIAVRRFCRTVFELLSFWNSFQLFKKFKKLSSFWYHMNKQNKFSSLVWIIGFSLTLTSQELRHWNVQFPELTLAWKWNTLSLCFARIENLLLQ